MNSLGKEAVVPSELASRSRSRSPTRSPLSQLPRVQYQADSIVDDEEEYQFWLGMITDWVSLVESPEGIIYARVYHVLGGTVRLQIDRYYIKLFAKAFPEFDYLFNTLYSVSY